MVTKRKLVEHDDDRNEQQADDEQTVTQLAPSEPKAKSATIDTEALKPLVFSAIALNKYSFESAGKVLKEDAAELIFQYQSWLNNNPDVSAIALVK